MGHIFNDYGNLFFGFFMMKIFSVKKIFTANAKHVKGNMNIFVNHLLKKIFFQSQEFIN